MKRLFPPGETGDLAEKPWIEVLGLFGLLLLALGVPLGKSTQLAGIFIMFIAFCANWSKTRYFVQSDPVVRLVIIFLLYVWGRTFWEVFSGHNTADTATLIDYARKHTYILFFPAVIWWMGASQRRIFAFYALISAGLVLHILFFSNLSLDTMLQGRSAIGGSDSLSGLLRNYAFLCSLAVIWLVLFGNRIAGLTHETITLTTVVRLLLWLMAVLLIIVMILTLQARSALVLTLFFLLSAAVIAIVRQLFAQKKNIHYASALLFILFAVVAVSLIYVNRDYVHDRFAREAPVIKDFLAGEDIDELQRSSFSIRLWLSLEGWELFLDSPVFGHASGNILNLLEESEREQIRQSSHLHNTYIEMLASWGIIGFSIMALIVLYSVYYLFYCRRQGAMDFQTWLFLLTAIMLLLVGGSDQSFTVRQHGWIFFIIIFAPAYSFGAYHRLRHKMKSVDT